MSLVLSQLGFQYPCSELELNSVPLLQKISLNFSEAGLLHIRGPNGSGKTSLLKLLAGMFRPDEGLITYAAENIWSNLSIYQQKIAYLGHKNGIHPALTVWENCRLTGAEVSSVPFLEHSLQALNLWSLRNQQCMTLSAGQKRRVALLRILTSSVPLWLLDEPLVALDAEAITFLVRALQHHVEKGGQVVYTSHQALPWTSSAHQEFLL